MSTYTDPYVFGEIPGLTNNALNRSFQTGRIKNWFKEAGWKAFEVPAILEIHTTGVPEFDQCLLGAGQDVFYQVKISGDPGLIALQDSESTCCEDSDDFVERTVTGNLIWTGGYNPIAGAGFGIRLPTASGGSGELCSANDLAMIKVDFSSVEAMHTITLNAAMTLISKRVGLLKAIEYPTVSDGAGGFITKVGILGQTPITWQIEFGGQLATTSTIATGAGFLLVGKDNIVNDNHMEMIMYWENEDSLSINNSNQIRFITRVGARFSDSPTIPYQDLVDDEEDDTINQRGGLTCADQTEGFISPTCFFLDNPSLGGQLITTAWGGAFRIKALEGESGTPNITKAIFLAATTQRINHGFDSWRDTNTPQPNCAFWVEAADTPARSWFAGQYHISHMGYTNSRSAGFNRDGIFWFGDNVASICEPWIGWNAFLDIAGGADPEDPAPVFCQIPDCIIPWRSIANGLPPSTDELFTWDGRIWRYYQTNRDPENDVFHGPGSRMAFRVADSRI